jgi:hypothetical protein
MNVNYTPLQATAQPQAAIAPTPATSPTSAAAAQAFSAAAAANPASASDPAAQLLRLDWRKPRPLQQLWRGRVPQADLLERGSPGEHGSETLPVAKAVSSLAGL